MNHDIRLGLLLTALALLLVAAPAAAQDDSMEGDDSMQDDAMMDHESEDSPFGLLAVGLGVVAAVALARR